jgi:hypothetical protein
MFHATILEGERAFRLSGAVAPYDLQMLREHVLAGRRPGTRVEVRLPAPLRAAFVRALGDVERRGVTLVIES